MVGDQDTLAIEDEQSRSLDVGAGRIRPSDAWSRRRQGSQIDPLRVGIALSKEEKVTAIRQELRQAMTALPWQVELGDRNRLTSGGGNTPQGACVRCRKHDGAITAPRTAASGWRIGECLRRTTTDVDTFQFAVCKKANRPAVE